MLYSVDSVTKQKARIGLGWGGGGGLFVSARFLWSRVGAVQFLLVDRVVLGDSEQTHLQRGSQAVL